MEYLYNSDILDVDIQVIAQQCNCVSKNGKGLSADIVNVFPHADFYSNRTRPSIPGTIEIKGGNGLRWVCAMYAQYYPGGPKNGDTSTQRILWFEQCLNKVAKIKNLRHIAFPDKIGCGLAQGDWPSYYALLYSFAEQNPNIRVTIVSRAHPNLSILTLEEAYQLFSATKFVYSIPNHGRPIEDVILDQIQRHVIDDFGPYVSLEFQVLEDAHELVINMGEHNLLDSDYEDHTSDILTEQNRDIIGGLSVPKNFDDRMYYGVKGDETLVPKARRDFELEVDVTLTLLKIISPDARIIPWIKYH